MSDVQPAIRLTGVSKQFPGGYTALEGVDITVAPGRFVSLVGPSGCGKSTALSLIAGLDTPTAGTVKVRDRLVNGVADGVGFLFQRDALLPWKNVFDNVAFPLVLRKRPAKEIAERVNEWIARVNLRGFENHFPSALSGGMRKRVALAQTLVYEPQIILMDEPFSALDVQTRDLMEDELLQLWQGSGMTIVFVTHDLEEAIALSDEVVVMTAGPARVKARYDVTLPRPRVIEQVRLDPRFTELYRAMWNDLRDEVLESYARATSAP